MAARVNSDVLNARLGAARRRRRMAATLLDDEADHQEPEPQEAAPPAVAEPPLPQPTPAFAVAVLAEQLPPESLSPLELRTRFNRTWQPPASELNLTNRRI